MFCRTKLVALSLALAISACSEPPSHVVVTQTRTASIASKPAIPGATTELRFGNSRAASPVANEVPIEWDAPSSWTQVAASQFRTVNYRLAGETECYVSLLPGAAGGQVANVNRWRSQMGLAPTTDDELEAGPKIQLFGQPAPLVVLEGSFSGMGAEVRSDWVMYGTLLVAPGGTLFVKMVGPRSEVLPERDNFVRFCGSIRERGASANQAAPQASAPAASQFAWNAPETWKDQGPRSMREVSYSFGTADEGECYVTVLGGGAGGIEANVNRWRTQIGLGKLTGQEIGELPQLDVLGGKATLFEATGAFTGMGGTEAEADQTVLGIIRELSGRVLFVKMVGPAELVAEERERFVAFCTSLREEG